MKFSKAFRLTTRAIALRDVTRECPFLPDDDETEVYLSSLAGDIQSLVFVERVVRQDYEMTIELYDEHRIDELRDAIKALFSGDFACKVLFVSLTKID